jgi:hypothetical protein
MKRYLKRLIWRLIMSEFTDASAAAVANLKAEVGAGGGLTGD